MSYKDKTIQERLSHSLRVLNTGMGAEKENALKDVIKILTESGKGLDYMADHPDLLLGGHEQLRAAYDEAMSANDGLAAQNESLQRENARLRFRTKLWDAWKSVAGKAIPGGHGAAIVNIASNLGRRGLISAGYLSTGPITHFFRERRKAEGTWRDKEDAHGFSGYAGATVLCAAFWMAATMLSSNAYDNSVKAKIVQAIKNNPCMDQQACTPIYLEPKTRSLLFRVAPPSLRLDREQTRTTSEMLSAEGTPLTLTC